MCNISSPKAPTFGGGYIWFQKPNLTTPYNDLSWRKKIRFVERTR